MQQYPKTDRAFHYADVQHKVPLVATILLHSHLFLHASSTNRIPLVAMMVERGVDLLHLRIVASTSRFITDVMGKIVLIPMHVAGCSSRLKAKSVVGNLLRLRVH